MATTVLNLIGKLRYDLRDTVPEYTYSDAELIEYLNRAVLNLDYELSRVNSDLVAKSSDVTLSSSDTSVDLPTGCILVRDAWIGTAQLNALTPYNQLQYDRQRQSTTGQPTYYCQAGNKVEFNKTADQDYTVKLFYDVRTYTSVNPNISLDLVSSDTMPYNDIYNNAIKQAIVLQAKSRNEMSGIEGAMMQIFSSSVRSREAIKRNLPPFPEKRKYDF
jgi:hypothetical protein